MNNTERLSKFTRELSYIQDEKLKEFAKALIINADDYFFTMPASTSGKYHPDFARGNGGLIRHTKAVAFFTYEIVRSELVFGNTITPEQGDLLVIAAIAHDMKKAGNNVTGHTVKEHPALAAEYVRAIAEENPDIITEEQAKYIARVVRSHMGPWSDVKPVAREELIVYYADYISSRKEIIGLDFIEANDDSEIEAPAPVASEPKYTVDDYVFTFGKAKGLTLKEADEKFPTLLGWIADKEDYTFKEVQNLVREYLKR